MTTRRPTFTQDTANSKPQSLIESLKVIEGHLPDRALSLVREWAMIHRQELRENWELCRANAVPAKIQPLASKRGLVYWDIVEVVPAGGYSLFVRFEDGLEGLVSLQPEKLTGALAPLRDEAFFKQVFIDGGVVAWPGNIDLAPDSMYADVAAEQRKAGLLNVADSATRLNSR